MKSKNELKSLFMGLLDDQNQLVFTCGSGVTACVLALAANIAGYDNLTVYDGSWSEWAINPEMVVVSQGEN